MNQPPASQESNRESPFPVSSIPEFGSPEHIEKLARRLSRNIRFRQRQDEWLAHPLAEIRRKAIE